MTRPTPERLAEIREIARATAAVEGMRWGRTTHGTPWTTDAAPCVEAIEALADALAEIDALRADAERLTRERDALAARVIEEHATYDALRADRDRLRRDLDVRIHGPAGRLHSSED